MHTAADKLIIQPSAMKSKHGHGKRLMVNLHNVKCKYYTHTLDNAILIPNKSCLKYLKCLSLGEK